MNNANDNSLTKGFLNQPPAYTQPAILQRLLALLTFLPSLTIRDDNDPTIALFDAWAMTLHVMAFYQQQFNKESYLATATELFSVRQLSRMIGHELNPGLAASTFLAFEVDPKANNTGCAIVPQGTQVQSLPSQGILPQTFETNTDLIAQASWNQLQPYQPTIFNEQVITGLSTKVWLTGITTGLTKGDLLLLMGIIKNSTVTVAFVLTVTFINPDNVDNRTQVGWQDSLSSAIDLHNNPPVALQPTDILMTPQLWVFRKRVGSFGNNAPLVSSFPSSSYFMQPERNDWDHKKQVPDGTNKIPTVWQDSQAKSFTPPGIYLNQSLPGIIKDSFILLWKENQQELYQVATTYEVSRADFGLSGQVTLLTLKKVLGKPFGDMQFRDTAIYAQSELLSLYANEINDEYFTLNNKTEGIPLNKVVPDLQIGQKLIISNLLERSSEPVTISSITATDLTAGLQQHTYTLATPLRFRYQPGSLTLTGPNIQKPIPVSLDTSIAHTHQLILNAPLNLLPANETQFTLVGLLAEQSEVFTVSAKQNIEGRTVLIPQIDLHYSYKPATSIIYGNVVEATHGATIANEVLGNGDATLANQRFSLNKSPLTYISASSLTGMQSTLTIQVNGIPWDEAPSLYDLSPDSKKYIVQQKDNGQVEIIFGDGIKGARLPTGQENIIATYRQGIGFIGEVVSNSLTLLQTRPQGIVSVTNPMPASGAAQPETLATAHHSVPSTVLTMNRIISLSDFEHFTQAFRGISKAQVQLLQQDNEPLLYITIAGENDRMIDINSNLYKNLLNAIATFRNPGPPVMIGNYEHLPFNLTAHLTLDPKYQPNQLFHKVEAALLATYSFDRQNLTQNVTAGRVIETIRSVVGVLAIDLDALYLTKESPTLLSILIALPARQQGHSIFPAQLLTINPLGIKFI
jgi:hypothetical protein